MKRRTVRFAVSQAAGTTTTYTRALDWTGEIQLLKIEFPPGSEGTLRLTPTLRKPNGTILPLLVTDDAGATNEFLSGDDRYKELAIDAEVKPGYVLALVADNQDAVNAHWFDFVAECSVREVA